MRLTALCVCGTLLAFSSLSWITADSDGGVLLDLDKGFGPCTATLIPKEPCRPGQHEGTCPYLFSLPPLTVQLPQQLRELERIVQDLEKLKDSVDQLREMCADCTATQSEKGECGRKTEGEDDRSWMNERLQENDRDHTSQECGPDRGKVENMEGDGDPGKRVTLEERERKIWDTDGESNKGVVKENERVKAVTEVAAKDGKTQTEWTNKKGKPGQTKGSGGHERVGGTKGETVADKTHRDGETDRKKTNARQENPKGNQEDKLEKGKEGKMTSGTRNKEKTEESYHHMRPDERKQTEKKTQTEASDRIKMSEDRGEHTNMKQGERREEKEKEMERGMNAGHYNEKAKQAESSGQTEKDTTIKEREEEQDREMGKEIKTDEEKLESVRADGELSSRKSSERTDFVSVRPTPDSTWPGSSDSNRPIIFSSSLPSPPLPRPSSGLITDVSHEAITANGPIQNTGPVAPAGFSESPNPDPEPVTGTVSTLEGFRRPITSTTAKPNSRSRVKPGTGFQGHISSTSTPTAPYENVFVSAIPRAVDHSRWTPKKNSSATDAKTGTKPLPGQKPKPGEKHVLETKPEADHKVKNPKNDRKPDRSPFPDKKNKYDPKQKPSQFRPTTDRSRPANVPKRAQIPKPGQRTLPDGSSIHLNQKNSSKPKHDQDRALDLYKIPLPKPKFHQKSVTPVERTTSHQRPDLVNATHSGENLQVDRKDKSEGVSPVDTSSKPKKKVTHPVRTNEFNGNQKPERKAQSEETTRPDHKLERNQGLSPFQEPESKRSEVTVFTLEPKSETATESMEKFIRNPSRGSVADRGNVAPDQEFNLDQKIPTLNRNPVTESTEKSEENPSLKPTFNQDLPPGRKVTLDQAKPRPDQKLKPSQEIPRLDQKPEIESIEKSNENTAQEPKSHGVQTPGHKITPGDANASPNQRPNPNQETSTVNQTRVTESTTNYGENPTFESTSNKESTPGLKSTPNQVEPRLDQKRKPSQERPRLDQKPRTESTEKSNEKPSFHGQKNTPDRGDKSQNQTSNPDQERSTVNQTPGQNMPPDNAETRPDQKVKPDQVIQTLDQETVTEINEMSDKNPSQEPLSHGVSTPGQKIPPDRANTSPNQRPNPSLEISTFNQTPVTDSIERLDKNPSLEPTFTDESTASEKSMPDGGHTQPDKTFKPSQEIPTIDKKPVTDKSDGSSSLEPTPRRDSTPGQRITPDQANTSPDRKKPSQQIPTLDQTDVTESMEKFGKNASPELKDLIPGGSFSPDLRQDPKFKPSQTKPALDEKPVTESTRNTDEITLPEPTSNQDSTPGKKLPPDQINTDQTFEHWTKIPIYDQKPETELMENSNENPSLKPSSNHDSSTGKKLTPKPNQRIPTLNQKPVTEPVGKTEPSSHGNSTTGKKIVQDRAKTRPDQRFRPHQKIPTFNEKPVSESMDNSHKHPRFRPTSDPESGPERKITPDRGNAEPDRKFNPRQKMPNVGKKPLSKPDKKPTFKPTTIAESTPGQDITSDGGKTRPDQKPGQKIPTPNEESDIKPLPDSTSNEESTAGQKITPDQTSPKQKLKPNLKIPKYNPKPVTESTKNSENPSLNPATNEGFPPEQEITPDRTNTRTNQKLKPNQKIPKINQKQKPGPESKPNHKIPKPVTDLKTKPNVNRKTDHSPQTNQRPKPPRPNLKPNPAPDETSKAEANKTSKQRPPSRFRPPIRPPVGPGATPVKRPKPAVQSEPSPKTETRLDPPLISWTTSDGIQNSQTHMPPVSGPGKQIAEMTHSPEAAEFTPNMRKTVTQNPKTSNSLETDNFSHLHTLPEDFTESPNSRIRSDLKPQTTSRPPSIMHEIFPNVVSSSPPGSTKPNLIFRSDSKSQAEILHNMGETTPSVPTPSPSPQTTSTLRPDFRSTTSATSGLQPPAAESSTPSARELRVKINQVAAFLNNSLSPNGETQVRPSKQQPEDTQGGSRPGGTEQPALIPSKGLTVRRDCSDHLLRGGTRTGVYLVTPDLRSRSFRVFCDMDLDGGGWTVLQRRQDGSVSFNRTWAEYRSGFGELDGGEFWLGNTGIHLLTRDRDMVLRVELEDFEGVEEYAEYEQFRVAGERLRYRLTVGGYSGTAGDALRFNKRYDHNSRPFTTPDRDHDRYPSGNCGAYYSSGWWFDACMAANLNGRYYQGSYKGVRDGIYWGTWHNISSEYYPTNDRQSFRRVRMMIRPKGFTP